MSDPETRPSREDLRENPGDMWDNMEPTQKFEGRVAEAKTPNSYQMTIAEGFRGNGSEIDTEKWHQWFYEKDKETNKDETYFNKLENAIGYWNSVPAAQREQFLSTGQYNDAINGQLVSLLTSARIIDLKEPEPEPVPPVIDPIPKIEVPETPIPPKLPIEKPIQAVEPVKPTPIVEQEPVVDPVPPVEPTPIPEPVIEPTPIVEPEQPTDPEPSYQRPGNTVTSPEDRIAVTPPTVEMITSDRKKPNPIKKFFGRFRREKPEQTPENNEDDDELKVLFRTEFASLTPEQQAATKEKVKDSRKKLIDAAKKGAIALTAALLLMNPFSKTTKNGEVSGISIKPANDIVETISDPDPTPTPKPSGEDDPTNPGLVPKITIDPGDPGNGGEPYRTTVEREVEKVVPLLDLDLGDSVQLPAGTELHYTSDKFDKNYSIHTTTKEGESYTVNRLAIWSADGQQLIATYNLPAGDTGKISDLLEKTRQEKGISEDTPLSLYYHYNQDGTELGWTDAGTATIKTIEEEEVELPTGGVSRPGSVSIEFVPKPPEPKNPTLPQPDDSLPPTPMPAYIDPITGQSIDFSNIKSEPAMADLDGDGVKETPYYAEDYFRGTIDDKKADRAEIRVGNDETNTEIPIRDANGDYYKKGDFVMGADGRYYEIMELQAPESKVEFKPLVAAHDLAVVGTAVAAIYLLGRKKREGEEGAETAPVAGAEQSGETEERRVVVNLSAEQLRSVIHEFSLAAGDRAGAIAEQFANESGIPAKTIAERTSNPAEGSIYANMSRTERSVACTLLSNINEPSSIDRLTQLLGVDYNEFIDRIGIDEAALAAARKPENNQEEAQ